MRRFALLLTLPLIISACGQPASPSETAAPAILASTTFLADITRNVAGDRVRVESISPIDRKSVV